MANVYQQFTCPAGEWTTLTTGAISGDVAIELISGPCWIHVTNGTTSPADDAEGVFSLEKTGNGWSQATLAEIFPSVPTANNIHIKPKTVKPTVIAVSFVDDV